jgi:hypothetical protein
LGQKILSKSQDSKIAAKTGASTGDHLLSLDEVPKGVLVSSGMTATVIVDAPPRQWGTLAALRGPQTAAR